MQIINETKRTVLASEARTANTHLRRFVGLIGRRRLMPGHGLVIEPCRSVHTFFMRFPIDVVYVDRTFTVMKVVPSLAPYRMSGTLGPAHAVIELPKGTAAQSGTEVGDVLALLPERPRSTWPASPSP